MNWFHKSASYLPDSDASFDKDKADYWTLRYILKQSNFESTPFAIRLQKLLQLRNNLANPNILNSTSILPIGVLTSNLSEVVPRCEDLFMSQFKGIKFSLFF